MRTVDADRSRGSGPRSPGVVYGALTVTLVVVVGVIALTTRQPPPPTIAEFAPQAVEQIKDAPSEQTSEFGSGEGGAAVGALEPTPTPRTRRSGQQEQAVLNVPRVRRCVGNPPRQIEDPQSPPCVPYWEGDNSGVTHPGVDGESITIAVPTGNPDQSPNDIFKPLFDFFNRRFEFYGRQLKPVEISPPYPNAGTNIQADQIAAARAAKAQEVFASLRFRTAQGFHYHDELARLKIPSFTGVEWGYDTPYLRANAPYLWQYTVETDVLFANIGEWACKRLASGNADYTDDVRVGGRPRKFGVILQTYYLEEETSIEPLVKELDACRARVHKPPLVNPIRSASGGSDPAGNNPANATNAMLQLQQDGVTSVLCECAPYALGNLMKAATQQGYFPEWLVSSYGAQDVQWGISLSQSPTEQKRHMLGVSFNPMQIPALEEPARWAAKEGDPAFNGGTASGSVGIWNFTYRNMLQLASAIQMAGPILTPETMARGAQRVAFPNPVHRNNPGRVGFQPNRFAMTLEGNEYWWSATATNPFGQTGSICYVDEGKRYRKGGWPSGKPDPDFFQGDCFTGA